jgi:hypothetical protein
VGLVELTHVEPLEPVADLVERLEQLEARLASGGPSAPRPAPSGGGGGARPAPTPRVAASPSSPGGPSSAAPASAAPSSAAAASAAPSSAAPSSAAPSSAAPSSAAPASAAPSSAAASPRPTSWTALAEALFARSPRFAVLLTGQEVTFAPPRLVVAFKNGFEATQAREKLAEVLPIARELVGQPVTIEVQEGATGAAPSVLEAEEERARADREKRRKEALDHPARQMVVEAFGPEVQFKDPEVE